MHLNISYPWPVHTQTGFAKLGREAGSLPMYPSPSVESQGTVIEALRKVLASL